MTSDTESGPSAGKWRLSTFDRGGGHRDAARRVREWVRTRFSLADGETVMVNEVACEMPGCPPIETVVAFWTEGGEKRHHYKIFKPLADVVEDDLPPYWMKDALAVGDEFYCSCC